MRLSRASRQRIAQADEFDLRELAEELEARAAKLEAKQAETAEVVDEFTIGAVTYQHEHVRCGKPSCHCAGFVGGRGGGGNLHGPYWYAYYRDNGRLRSRYIGKRFRRIDP